MQKKRKTKANEERNKKQEEKNDKEKMKTKFKKKKGPVMSNRLTALRMALQVGWPMPLPLASQPEQITDSSPFRSGPLIW